MIKFIKAVVLLIVFLFSGVFLLGFLMYAVYFMYKNYENKVDSKLEKYPEVSHLLRKFAAFTSSMLQEEKVSTSETVAEVKKVVKSKVKNSLNQRQNKILEMLKEQEKAEMSEIKKFFPKINVRTLRRDLSKLESENFITKTGRTKGSFYKVQ